MKRRNFLLESLAAGLAGPVSLSLTIPCLSHVAPPAGEVGILLVDTDRASAPVDERIYGGSLWVKHDSGTPAAHAPNR